MYFSLIIFKGEIFCEGRSIDEAFEDEDVDPVVGFVEN